VKNRDLATLGNERRAGTPLELSVLERQCKRGLLRWPFGDGTNELRRTNNNKMAR